MWCPHGHLLLITSRHNSVSRWTDGQACCCSWPWYRYYLNASNIPFFPPPLFFFFCKTIHICSKHCSAIFVILEAHKQALEDRLADIFWETHVNLTQKKRTPWERGHKILLLLNWGGVNCASFSPNIMGLIGRKIKLQYISGKRNPDYATNLNCSTRQLQLFIEILYVITYMNISSFKLVT